MRALQLTNWKHEPEFNDVAEPDPGPGELVIKVGGAGACHSDLHLMHDFEPGLLPYVLPFTLGHENAGWVHAVGAGVKGLEIGESVAVYGPWGCGRCHNCRQGMENYCMRQGEIGAAGGGLGRDGGMAPYQLIPDQRFVVPIGDLDPAAAAPLTDAALTPYHGKVGSGRVGGSSCDADLEDLMAGSEPGASNDCLCREVGRFGRTAWRHVSVMADVGEGVHEPAAHPLAAELGADDEAEMGVARCSLVDPALASRSDLAIRLDEVELLQVDALGQEPLQERFG